MNDALQDEALVLASVARASGIFVPPEIGDEVLVRVSKRVTATDVEYTCEVYPKGYVDHVSCEVKLT